MEKKSELIEIPNYEKCEESWSDTTPNEIYSILELGTITLRLCADVEPLRLKFIRSYDSNHENEMQIQFFGGSDHSLFFSPVFRTRPRRSGLILANVSIHLSIPETDC